jgi:hypothetical protein
MYALVTTWIKRNLRLVTEKICYCFNCTADDIRKDLDSNGKSTIMESNVAEKKKEPDAWAMSATLWIRP